MIIENFSITYKHLQVSCWIYKNKIIKHSDGYATKDLTNSRLNTVLYIRSYSLDRRGRPAEEQSRIDRTFFDEGLQMCHHCLDDQSPHKNIFRPVVINIKFNINQNFIEIFFIQFVFVVVKWTLLKLIFKSYNPIHTSAFIYNIFIFSLRFFFDSKEMLFFIVKHLRIFSQIIFWQIVSNKLERLQF